MYSILISYANKNNSPYIEINPFLEFLGRYAKKQAAEQPEWNKWVHDRAVKFWAEVSALVEGGKCELLTDTDDGRVYVSNYYLELLNNVYQSPDDDSDMPFPSEESLRIVLPESQIRPMNCDSDLLSYLKEPQESDVPVLRITFPDGFGSALILASLIPRRLAEMAILKVRNYLRRSGNKEYALRKLSPQLHGKESFLRDQLNQVLIKPLDTFTAIEAGRDLSYLFWAHFCILVKNDIKKKKEYLGDDIAALQSVCIIETINGYYKALAVKKREMEMAFGSLSSHLAKPPFLYTLDEILKFTSDKGVLLLSLYTKEELETWLKNKTTESVDDELPPLLIIQGLKKGELYFLLKEKMLVLCSRLLAEARPKVKDAIYKQWRALLSEYKSEPAMEDDAEFDRALRKFTEKLFPALANLLEDPKLHLVNDEMEQSQNGVPLALRYFNKGKLLPYSTLFIVKRKEILSDAKLMLPFWYSLPIISAIIAFFKNLFRKKAQKSSTTDQTGEEENGLEEMDQAAELRAAASELEFTMVPAGYTLESYLEVLENRWSRLIDRKARENLIEDVKSLIRDHLRRNLKLKKNFKLSQEIINEMAANIVTRTPALASLSGKDSLILYSELYLIQLIENIK